MSERDAASQQLSPVLITLFKGVFYQDTNPALWQGLLALQARVRDYVAMLGLELLLDEAEGYAYLRQKPQAEDDEALPRLVQRRPLSYPVSLLLALLRKKLAEFDAAGGDTRLVLTGEQIVELVRVFLPDTANEARLLDRIDSHINKLVELGFLRKLRGQEHQFEVMRILKTFVEAQWLAEFDERLKGYRSHIAEAGE
ncbi:MAG: DUF4194 domain-containing protein [Actinomycetota bacterium]